MTRVHVTFSAALRRWDIASEGWSGRCDLTVVRSGLEVGRGPDGRIRELSLELDEVRPQSDIVALVAEAFGETIAGLVVSSDGSTDIDALIGEGTERLERAATPPLSDEPGIPVKVDDEVFAIPFSRGRGRLIVRQGSLEVTIPDPGRHRETWIRISDAETGIMLALGPTPPPRRIASVPFALGLPPEVLHVDVSSDPIRDVGSRAERRRAWVMGLMAEAELAAHRRPGRSAAVAAEAARVADAIGDDSLATTARLIAATSARRGRLRVAGVMIAAGLAVAALVVLPRVLGGGDGPTGGPFYENCPAARRAGVAPIRRGEPGYRTALDRDADGVACEG
jgi:hypothetical protein